jgi:hypothetical protein
MPNLPNLPLSVLADCLEAACVVHNRKMNDKVTDLYFLALGDLDKELVTSAFATTLDDRYFPTPARIRELVTGVTSGADWHTIVAVASGAKKAATISGISAMALVTATTTSGLGTESPANASQSEAPSQIDAALRRIAFCDDPFTLRAIRKDWDALVAVPPVGNALPPADVEISLTSKAAKVDMEYPADLDYEFQTASMIRCIQDKKAISPAWVPIINRFPAARKAEVMEFAKANGFVTPEIEASSMYKKHLSIGRAMLELNESEINGIINSERKTAKANGFENRDARAGSAQQEIWRGK